MDLMHLSFCIFVGFKNVLIGFINEQISIISDRVMALAMYKKWFLASSSFTIWNISVKLHENDLSNSFVLLKKFCPHGLLAPALGLYTYIKHGKKNNRKSEFKVFFMKVVANKQST